jgi:hypothetical protein|tara:strand:+ start:39 stop:653 length:615 start_codon:yes stop_codon:yes gene_type:complete
MSTEIEVVQESQLPSIVNELDDIEEAGLMYIKGYKISEIATVMSITPKRARKHVTDYKEVLNRRTQEDPYFLEKVQYNTLKALDEFDEVSKEAWETVTIATDHGMISARVQALKLAGEMAAKKAQLHHLLGGNNADVEYVARMQRAESVNQILSKILRDTISQHPDIAEEVRSELALAFELMESPDENAPYITAEAIEVDDAGN